MTAVDNLCVNINGQKKIIKDKIREKLKSIHMKNTYRERGRDIEGYRKGYGSG